MLQNGAHVSFRGYWHSVAVHPSAKPAKHSLSLPHFNRARPRRAEAVKRRFHGRIERSFTLPEVQYPAKTSNLVWFARSPVLVVLTSSSGQVGVLWNIRVHSRYRGRTVSIANEPQGVIPDDINCRMDHGLLTVRIPKQKSTHVRLPCTPWLECSSAAMLTRKQRRLWIVRDTVVSRWNNFVALGSLGRHDPGQAHRDSCRVEAKKSQRGHPRMNALCELKYFWTGEFRM